LPAKIKYNKLVINKDKGGNIRIILEYINFGEASIDEEKNCHNSFA
jgi:hypothetical protein